MSPMYSFELGDISSNNLSIISAYHSILSILVGKSALYLLSDLGSGVTGEILHVDSGYHIVGMKAVDAPDIDAVTGRKD